MSAWDNTGMGPEAWRVVFGITRASNVLDELEQTPFDKKYEIDMVSWKCRNVFHVEDKYEMPPPGRFDQVNTYVQNHLIHPEDRARHREFMDPATFRERLEAAVPKGMLQNCLRLKLKGNDWVWTRFVLVSGEANGAEPDKLYLYIYDIQAQRDRLQGRPVVSSYLLSGMHRDELTGLYTEKDYFDLVQARLGQLQGTWCILDVDIEHFKLFTDWHGHERARELLKQFGRILDQTAGRCGGAAGYFGADDFSLFMPYDIQAVEALYGELRHAVASSSETIGFSPLIGICCVDSSTEQVLEAYNHAALSTESLKGNVMQHIAVFDLEKQKKSSEEYRLLLDFQNAIHSGEITFDLQPQCLVGNGKVIGAESLARWRKHDGTMVPPNVFVPILEKFGIVTNLDQFIWEEVCKWIRDAKREGLPVVPVSVNVSQIDLHTIDVPAYFSELTGKYGISPEEIKIEITESACVDDAEKVIQSIQCFQEMGFVVLMDDFGSGYSSLNMLRKLHVDVIKLDAQFLRIEQQEERKGIGILESIVNMTKMLALPVIVEGVETREQVNFLSRLGCSYMQGFYFYHPMTCQAFSQILADPSRVDLHGFHFQANQEMHMREFLDDNIYSDAMLNRILGPVAFYCLNDENVDIIRYNQQFYDLVGISAEEMDERMVRIQRFIYPPDLSHFYGMFEQAYKDRLNGGEGVVRVYRPNGVIIWMSIHVYFINEDGEGRKYYASAEDVTELQYINSDLPGGYFRTSLDDGFVFRFVSRNFQELTGFTPQELYDRYDNRLIHMVYPKDRDRLVEQSQKLERGEIDQLDPYRIQRRSGDYIWVVDRSRLTDAFGALSWQSVLIDVTEMMETRNQMRLLMHYASLSIVFLIRNEKGAYFRVVAHGMDVFQMDAASFEASLNDNTFVHWMTEEGESEGWQSLKARLRSGTGFAQALLDELHAANEAGRGKLEYVCRVNFPDGRVMRARLNIDRVTDLQRSAQYILVITSV